VIFVVAKVSSATTIAADKVRGESLRAATELDDEMPTTSGNLTADGDADLPETSLAAPPEPDDLSERDRP
jgi:hypothetical protein